MLWLLLGRARGSAGPGQALEAVALLCPALTLSLLVLLSQMENVKQGVDQKLVEGQEKLHQMWLNWNQKELQGTEANPAKLEVPAWGTHGMLRALTSLSMPLLDGLTCVECFPYPLLPFAAFRTHQHLLQEAHLDFLSWVWVLLLNCDMLDSDVSQPAKILSHISFTFSFIPVSLSPPYSPAWLLVTTSH